MTENKEYKLATPLEIEDWTSPDDFTRIWTIRDKAGNSFSYGLNEDEDWNEFNNIITAIVTLVNNSARYREALEKIMAIEERETGIYESGYSYDYKQGWNNCLDVIQESIARTALENVNESEETNGQRTTDTCATEGVLRGQDASGEVRSGTASDAVGMGVEDAE